MGYHFNSRLTATLNLCLIYFKTTLALAILLEHMHKKFEINRTKIKSVCQSGRKAVTHKSKSDFPLTSIVYDEPDVMAVFWQLLEAIHCSLVLRFKNVKRLTNRMARRQYSIQSREPRIYFVKFPGKLFTIRCHSCALTFPRQDSMLKIFKIIHEKSHLKGENQIK